MLEISLSVLWTVCSSESILGLVRFLNFLCGAVYASAVPLYNREFISVPVPPESGTFADIEIVLFPGYF